MNDVKKKRLIMKTKKNTKGTNVQSLSFRFVVKKNENTNENEKERSFQKEKTP